MIAAVLAGPRDIRLETIADPSVQSDEILVKVMAAGICGTDAHIYKIGSSPMFRGRLILGHEFSGQVVKVGSAVEGIKVRDRVMGIGYRHCGTCPYCRQGRTDRCSNRFLPGYGLDGAFAEYVVVPNPKVGQALFKVPRGMSWEEAATLEPVSIGCRAAERAMIQPNTTAVILGAGMIGQCVMQACKAMGVNRVIVSEPSPRRLLMAKKLGAEVVLNPREVNLVDVVGELTGGELPELVFECSGAPVAFQQALQMVRPFGKVMQVGMFEGTLGIDTDLMRLLRRKNITLCGCGGQSWNLAQQLVQAGKVKTAELITHRFPLSKAREAFETQLDAAEAIKVMINPN